MKNQLKLVLSLILLALTFLQCNNETNKLAKNVKFHPNDPFQKTIVPSQIFDIDTKKDNVIEGKHGTILAIPEGCFKNSNGETVSDNVKIELAEAFSIDQMLQSNLTTTSNGELIETAGMIYLNATANGVQLNIDKNNPPYVQIPTNKRKTGMMLYKGIRDENGNMDWVAPKALEQFLVAVDLNLLDFYPEGFEAEVIAGMPFRNHKTATKALIDSLYYSLSASDGSEMLEGYASTNLNEAYYNQNKTIKNGQYTYKSFVQGNFSVDALKTITKKVADATTAKKLIDPATIKVLKSDKFQNTLISTREFETRLQSIFKTCRNDIIELYINNLDKNLWEIDSIAAAKLGDHHLSNDFHDYYKQGLTNVKDAAKYTKLLQGFYEQQLSKIKSELKSAKDKFTQALQEKNEVAQKVVDEYKDVLWQREKHRMETYGFIWTESGWVNIDRPIVKNEIKGNKKRNSDCINKKSFKFQKFEIFVQEGQKYDRVHSYIVYTSIKSLYRLNSSNKESFHVGNEQQQAMLMPKKGTAVGISIAYKEETPFLAIKEFELGSSSKLNLNLQQSTTKKIATAISSYDDYGEENSINKDLEYMMRFAQEKKRQEQLKSESQFIARLWQKAYHSCYNFTFGVDEYGNAAELISVESLVK